MSRDMDALMLLGALLFALFILWASFVVDRLMEDRGAAWPYDATPDGGLR